MIRAFFFLTEEGGRSRLRRDEGGFSRLCIVRYSMESAEWWGGEIVQGVRGFLRGSEEAWYGDVRAGIPF